MASERDIQDVINTLIAEGIGEGEEGMRRIAETILTRAEQRGISPAEVVRQRAQYTGYSAPGPAAVRAQSDPRAISAAQAAWELAQGPDDPTGGANHYFNPNIVTPSWARGMTPTGTYQNHAFYTDRPVPPLNIPRVSPNPATISPDLSLMRNPVMSSTAQTAQVTPPLPQRRPVSPMDIARAPGQTIATIPTTRNPGQSQIERITPMPSAREIAMAPGTTVATIPTTPRASLPALPRTIPGQSQIERTMPSTREIASAPGTTIATIPTSGIGQPPATRTVPSVPYTLQPTAREIAQAPGVTVATIPTAPTTPQPMNMRSRDSVANAALGQRVAAQVGPAFSQPSFVPNRLVPNPIVQPTTPVPLNQPTIQVVPSPLSSAVPLPRRRPLTPIAPVQRVAPQPMPRMAQAASPLRVTVQGAGSYNAPRPQPMTPIQSLMAQGMSQAQAYNQLTRQAPTLEDRVTGRGGLASSGASAYSLV